MPYVVVGGCALLALAIAAAGTIALVSLGRDTPPDQADETLQRSARLAPPTAQPPPTATPFTVVLAGPTPQTTGSPRPGAPADGAARVQPTATAAPRLQAGPRAGVTSYTVVAGDTLGLIAARYGLSVQTLVQANQLSDPSVLKPGQELLLPPADGVLYSVQAGDTVNKIAQSHGASAEEVGRVNGLDSSYAIQVGQILVIPSASLPASAPTGPSPTAVRAEATGPAPPTSAAATLATAGPAQLLATPQPQASPAVEATPALPLQVPRGSFEWPAMGGVVRPFSADHPGIDLAGGQGAPVLASAAGTVANILQADSGYGRQILLDHGGGFSTLYGHLSAARVQTGDRVAKLQVIGAVGQTGGAPGPQLHFEVRQNGRAVDPRPYLP